MAQTLCLILLMSVNLSYLAYNILKGAFQKEVCGHFSMFRSCKEILKYVKVLTVLKAKGKNLQTVIM